MKKTYRRDPVAMQSPVFQLIDASVLKKLIRRRNSLRKKEGLPAEEWSPFPDIPTEGRGISFVPKDPTEEEIEKEMRRAPSHQRQVK